MFCTPAYSGLETRTTCSLSLSVSVQHFTTPSSSDGESGQEEAERMLAEVCTHAVHT